MQCQSVGVSVSPVNVVAVCLPGKLAFGISLRVIVLAHKAKQREQTGAFASSVLCVGYSGATTRVGQLYVFSSHPAMPVSTLPVRA